MSHYATFFLAAPEDLRSGFPGWERECPSRQELSYAVPPPPRASRLVTMLRTWLGMDAPARRTRSGAPAAAGATPTVISGHGNYEQYLENRIPPFVQAHPHWATKGLTDVELEPLCPLLHVTPTFDQPLFAPLDFNIILEVMPKGLITALKAADIRPTAARWAETLSTPEYTHSSDGERVCDAWGVDDAAAVLDQLVALAHKAEPSQRMYLLLDFF